MSVAIAVRLALVFTVWLPGPMAPTPAAQPNAAIRGDEVCAGATLEDLRNLYRRGQYGRVVELCASPGPRGIELPAELVVLRSQARDSKGRAAVERAEALAAEHPHTAAVRSTLATVYLSLGRLDQGRAEVDAALALDADDAEAWLGRASLRLLERDGAGALAALDRATAADPALRGAYTAHVMALGAARVTRDPELVSEVLEARAAHLEERGLDGEPARVEAEMLRQGSGDPLFSMITDADPVVLPFTPCWEGSVYRCISLQERDREYRVLLDTGNRPGWTVHAPELLEVLPNHFGGASSLTTGSVDTAMAGRILMTQQASFGPLVIHDLPGHFFPKPREPYFDANLSPFFVQDRVITMDHVNGQVLLRSKERFDEDLARARSEGRQLARVPLYGADWGFIPIQVEGSPAWAMIETGAEIFQLTDEFVATAGIPATPATMRFRDRDYHYHEAEVNTFVGEVPLFQGAAHVWPGRWGDTYLGMLYDAVIGPVLLEGRFILSYDPFDRMIVIELVERTEGDG